MQQKNLSAQEAQGDLFQSRLDQILDNGHPLFQLARQIDWSFFDTEFGQLFVENVGRPGLPTRLIVGLHYLKHTFNESDESVVERFLENSYWQYFCGFEYFQHRLPLDPSSMVRWRKRLGPDTLEKLHVETLETAKRGKLLTPRHVVWNESTTIRRFRKKPSPFPMMPGFIKRPDEPWFELLRRETSISGKTTSGWARRPSSSRAATPMPASSSEQESKLGSCKLSWAGSSGTSGASARFPMRIFPAC